MSLQQRIYVRFHYNLDLVDPVAIIAQALPHLDNKLKKGPNISFPLKGEQYFLIEEITTSIFHTGTSSRQRYGYYSTVVII